jgi:hypothetical protein
MMRLKTSVWAWRSGLVVAALFAGNALADEGPRYTYGEIGYSRVDYDDLNNDGDFFDAGVSLAVHDMVHLFADYSTGSVDVSSFDVDVTNVDAGAGLNLPLTKTVDLIVDVAYLWTEFDAGGGGNNSVDEDGYGARVGVRAMLTPNFELNGGGSYANFDHSDDNTAVYGGLVYNFTRMFAVSAGVSVGDNVTSYDAGLRLYLGDK